MNIAIAIMYMYPSAEPMRDFIVQDDSNGEGPYISAWNLSEPQPTEAELQAAWKAYQEAEANKPPKLTEVEQLQIDNAAMLLELAQTQARQDQTERDQAALLLSLVEGGVL